MKKVITAALAVIIGVVAAIAGITAHRNNYVGREV